MVRVNIINPEKLSDQHLVAEYNEILMLVSYIKKYPRKEDIPIKYCLGKGHMKFFKDKGNYLNKRHESIKSEMRKRGFQTNKKINLDYKNKKIWVPKKEDIKLIKERIISKLKNKPFYYRYYGEYKPTKFFIELLKDN